MWLYDVLINWMSTKNSTYWCACLRNNQKSFEYFDYFLSTFDVFHYVSQDNSDSFLKLSNQPEKVDIWWEFVPSNLLIKLCSEY